MKWNYYDYIISNAGFYKIFYYLSDGYKANSFGINTICISNWYLFNNRFRYFFRELYCFFKKYNESTAKEHQHYPQL